MFEVGKGYMFSQAQGDHYTSWYGEVLEIDGNLIKVVHDEITSILNTGAISFEGARETAFADIEDLPDYLKPPEGPTD